MNARSDRAAHAQLIRRGVLLAVAVATFLVLSWASSSHADGVQRNAAGARNQRREPPITATANFAVTPAVNPAARKFVRSRSDVSRSLGLAPIVIPLILALLVEGELLSVGGRAEGRVLVAFGVPMFALFAVLVYARVQDYIT
jgi:hypothetical protein